MTPTRPGALVGLVALFAAVGFVVADAAYGSLPTLPLYAPVSMAMLAVAELAMAKVVRDRIAHRPARGRALHPMQVARAAVLSKASSTAAAVLLGGYGGLLAWTLPRRDELALADRDALVAGLSVLASLALVVAALLLERSCRTPEDPDGPPTRVGA